MSALFEMADEIRRRDLDRNSRIYKLETALNRMICAHENTLSESGGRYPLKDAGCIDCTSGTVPDLYNTGHCAYHEAKVLLGQI